MDLKFLNVDIEIGGVQYPNQFSDDIRIDRTDLDGEFQKQPELYAYYAAMEAMAKHRKQVLKHEVDVVYAQTDARKRVEAQGAGLTKYTEKMCENEVKTDPAYRKKVAEYLEAEKLANLLGAFREAMNNRRESLISMGANARTGSFSPRVMEQQQTSYKENHGQAPAAPVADVKPVTEPKPVTKTRRRPAKSA
jgi:hypothetical protein